MSEGTRPVRHGITESSPTVEPAPRTIQRRWSARQRSSARGPAVPSAVPTTRELVGGTPAIVWLLVALTGVVTLLATVFYPNYRGPDETAHIDLVVAVAERSVDWQPHSMPLHRGVDKGPLVARTRLNGALHLGKDSMPPRSERKSYTALGGDAPQIGATNYIVQHPPLYYIVVGSVLGIVPHWQSMPFDRIILILRLLTTLLIIPVPWLCYAAVRTLAGSRDVATAAAAVPLMVPQLAHIGATVNNDALVTLLGAIAVWLVTRVYEGDLSRRTAGELGVVCAALCLTKGFGLVLTLLVVVVYAMTLVRYRQFSGLWRPLLRCAAWFAPVLLFSSTWWLGNLRMYDRLQPDGTLSPDNQHRVLGSRTTFAESGWKFIRTWVDSFTQRFWFDDPTGIQQDRLLHLVALVATLIVVGLVIVLLLRPAMPRALTIVILGFVAVIAGQLMHSSWPSYRATLFVFAAQGRYLFGGIVAIALLIAFGLAAVLGANNRWVPRGAVTAAVLLQIAGGLDTIRFYWLPAPGTSHRGWQALQSLLYVSPLPPWALVPLLLAVVGLSIVVVCAVWFPDRPRPWAQRRHDAREAVRVA